MSCLFVLQSVTAVLGSQDSRRNAQTVMSYVKKKILKMPCDSVCTGFCRDVELLGILDALLRISKNM